MKTLQDSEEKTRELTGAWAIKTIEFKPEHPRSITLLLHGYNERGLRLFRKLKRFLPIDSHIIAPNAPFPLPRVKQDRIDYGYAWYFYDRFTQSYHVDQKLAVGLLTDLLEKINPQGLPVTIIGFSQGGYLAPVVGFNHPSVKHVIGIGCEFRRNFFPHKPAFSLAAIHGKADELVNFEHAKTESEYLNSMGILVDWHELNGLNHEITNDVAIIVSQLMEQYGKASL